MVDVRMVARQDGATEPHRTQPRWQNARLTRVERNQVSRLVVAALGLLVSGCALFGVSGPSEAMLGQWELVDGKLDGQAISVPDGHRVTLLIEEEQLGGTSACNSYGGEHRIGAGRFETDGLGGTDMGCEPDVMEAETRYLEALGRAETIQVADDQLVLLGPGAELRFDTVAPVADEEIVGTRWVLETMVEGEVASSVAGDGFLELHDDGTLEGSTGCRSLRGRWTTNGDQILFPEFAADGECPEQLQAQDGHVVTVLGDGFRAAVEGEQLTVTSTGDLGLVYRAEP